MANEGEYYYDPSLKIHNQLNLADIQFNNSETQLVF